MCGVWIITDRSIVGTHLEEAHSCLIQFVEEFENLYYQWRANCLHFCRPCVHTLLHVCDEVTQVGPGAYSTQFTMEHMIGDLAQEIRQPSNPFANLTQCALWWSQVNALKNIYPDLDPTAVLHLLKFSQDLGHGYVLLQPRDKCSVRISGQGRAILSQMFNISMIRQWGRLCLLNGQVAWSLWCESKWASSRVWVTRNVKVCLILQHSLSLGSKYMKIELNGQTEYAKIQFYFLHFSINNLEEVPLCYALVSVYSCPVQEMLVESSNTLWACRYHSDDDLQVVNCRASLHASQCSHYPLHLVI